MLPYFKCTCSMYCNICNMNWHDLQSRCNMFCITKLCWFKYDMCCTVLYCNTGTMCPTECRVRAALVSMCGLWPTPVHCLPPLYWPHYCPTPTIAYMSLSLMTLVTLWHQILPLFRLYLPVSDLEIVCGLDASYLVYTLYVIYYLITITPIIKRVRFHVCVL